VSLINQPVTEYEVVLRLGEVYLIRAEARAQLGEANSINDINFIRKRAGLPSYLGATDKSALLTAILHERRLELFTEWGHRWLDLKRTSRIDAIMNIATPQKGGVWTSGAQYYPIVISELQHDPNLVQNPGY
jgi:hypothetical protein